jgi:2-methylisocitrate lyase-like PEP mutase family enzyme
MRTSRDKALHFRSLHVPGQPVTLPNAWDVGTARIVEDAGAAAVATTSAGMSWSLGVPDGDHLQWERALEVIARIAAAVEVPVTADIESGYASSPQGVARTITAVLDAGVVGVNLEDSLRTGPAVLRDVDDQCQRIAAARGAADSAGVPLFINARVDTHRLALHDVEAWLLETLTRARAYADAGADGVFVLGALDSARVCSLVAGVDAPVNVLTGPGHLSVAELASLGVARVSAGSSIAEASYGLVARAVNDLLSQGTSSILREGMAYGSMNSLVQGRLLVNQEPGTGR